MIKDKEKELARQIVEYCIKEKIKASYNISYGSKLVNFEVKDKKIICSKCGQIIKKE